MLGSTWAQREGSPSWAPFFSPRQCQNHRPLPPQGQRPRQGLLRSFISCRELGVQAGGEGSREPPALSPPRPPPQWQNLPMGAGLCHLPPSRVRGTGQCGGRGSWAGMGAQAAAAPGMEQRQPGLAVSPRFPQEMQRAGGSNARGWASSGPRTPQAPRPTAEHAGSVPGACRERAVPSFLR